MRATSFVLAAFAALASAVCGAADLGKIAMESDLDETRATVQSWESFLAGSNIVFSITNYQSNAYGTNSPKFRIMQLDTNRNEYVEIYNSWMDAHVTISNELSRFQHDTLENPTNGMITVVSNTEVHIEAVYQELMDVKADKRWGRYTSLGDPAPSNTVTIAEQYTEFSGGTGFAAVGLGTMCVLANVGAPSYAEGTEGTFKFQSDGGTNYFGFARSDTYVLGCDTDSIGVSNGMVHAAYDISYNGVPCIWYTPTLDVRPIVWEQLSLADGSACEGASHVVAWEEDAEYAEHKVCHIAVAEDEKSGFFRATIEMGGSSKFMTNMPADLAGGIICTNELPSAVIKTGRCFPYTDDGTTVKWRYVEGVN